GAQRDIHSFPTRRSSDLGESSQPSALPWDQIAPTPFKATNMLSDAALKQLRGEYESRLKNDAILKELIENTKMIKETRKESRISDRKSTRLNSSHVKISY